MLNKILINNIALIDFCEVDFDKHLNVFSGETGSGKSIVIDAISFVLGGRLDKSIIKSGCDFAKVSAVFNGTVLERTLTKEGKNTCLINGEKTTLLLLKEAASALIDIHGQHEHQKLLNEKNHAEILDIFIGEKAAEIKSEIATVVNEISKLSGRIKNIGGNSEERERTADFLNFQIKEIENANIKEGEFEELKAKKEVLVNKQKILENLAAANSALSGEDGMRKNAYEATYALSQIKNFKQTYSDIHQRLNSLKIDLEDVACEIENEFENENNGENNLAEIEERLDVVKTIFRKYGTDFESVIQTLASLKQKYGDLTGSEQLLEELNKKTAALIKNGLDLCGRLTVLRKCSAKLFEEKIKAELCDLGMHNAKFEVLFYEKESFDKNGLDEIVFLFSANIGEAPKQLSRIISGGELSRLSLAIKTLTAHKDNIETMIFDEADTGISGNMAQVVAKKLAIVSRSKQVFVVSHLPQIAAFADTNFLVEKTDNGKNTKTSVEKIAGSAKTAEVARLIGSSMAGTYAFSHANEMVEIANKFKQSIE